MDTVKVIRCKQCKYWLEHFQCGWDEARGTFGNYCGRMTCESDYYGEPFEADDFCSRGEPKQDEVTVAQG